jgi:hypothetical protein
MVDTGRNSGRQFIDTNNKGYPKIIDQAVIFNLQGIFCATYSSIRAVPKPEKILALYPK